MLREDAIRHAKDVFVTFLRLYFQNPRHYRNKLPKQISDELFTTTVFSAAEPEDLRSLPMVIITAASGNLVTAGLGDMGTEIRDARTGAIVAYRYEGFYELSFNIDVGCRTPLEREVLADLVAKAIRFDLRRFMQNNGVLVKDLSYAGEAVVDYNSDKIYTSQLRVNTWSSWVEDRQLLDPDEFDIHITMREANESADTQHTVLDETMDRHLDHGEEDINDPNSRAQQRYQSGAIRKDP